MSKENGSVPPDGCEPVQFTDIVAYWRNHAMDLHDRLAIAEARIRNRDAIIASLQPRGEGVSEHGLGSKVNGG